MTLRPPPADPHPAPGDASAPAAGADGQSIGARLLVRGPELRVVAVSANADGLLGRPLPMILGRCAADLLPPALAARLPPALAALEHDPVVALGWLPLGRGGWLTVQLRRSAGQLSVELEPGGCAEVAELGEARGGGEPGERTALRWLRRYQQALAGAQTLSEACAEASTQLQALTGYEQIVVLRTVADVDGGLHAAVPLPEGAAPPWWERLAQHRPPFAAERRALLRESGYVYAVADVEAEAVPLIWAEQEAAQSRVPAGSRSVLDAPAEFVRLGLLGVVRAALVLTLSDGVEPWGCVLCGHSRPRWPSPQVRELCALAGIQLFVRLEQLDRKERQSRRQGDHQNGQQSDRHSDRQNDPRSDRKTDQQSARQIDRTTNRPTHRPADRTDRPAAPEQKDRAGRSGFTPPAVSPPSGSSAPPPSAPGVRKEPAQNLSMLAGGFAHDLNNLLTAVLGSVTQTRAALLNAQPAETYLDQIETAVMCAGDLCRQVLAYAGRGALTVEPISLSQLVAQMLPLLQLSTGGRARLKLQLLDDLPLVVADAIQLRQVLLNLVTNGAEAIGAVRSEGGEIFISTRLVQLDADSLRAAYTAADASPGLHVALKVCDNGVGMDKAVLERAFEPFFTTKASDSPVGRGLGLSIVLGVVKGHRGVLSVRSSVGQGTEFDLMFPCARAAPRETARVPADGPSLQRLSTFDHTILVVDDEPTVREFIARVLRTAGYKVLQAGTAEEALALAAAPETPISLALIDWALHPQEGEFVARKLHGLRSALPLVILSGYGPSEYADRLHGLPIAGSLQKPFRLDALLRLVQRIITRTAL